MLIRSDCPCQVQDLQKNSVQHWLCVSTFVSEISGRQDQRRMQNRKELLWKQSETDDSRVCFYVG
jgi:hypothetical protein